jgi:hypothetical protein
MVQWPVIESDIFYINLNVAILFSMATLPMSTSSHIECCHSRDIVQLSRGTTWVESSLVWPSRELTSEPRIAEISVFAFVLF